MFFNLFIPHQVTNVTLIYDQLGQYHLMYSFGFVLIIEYFKSLGIMFPTLWSTLIYERRLKVSPLDIQKPPTFLFKLFG